MGFRDRIHSLNDKKTLPVRNSTAVFSDDGPVPARTTPSRKRPCLSRKATTTLFSILGMSALCVVFTDNVVHFLRGDGNIMYATDNRHHPDRELRAYAEDLSTEEYFDQFIHPMHDDTLYYNLGDSVEDPILIGDIYPDNGPVIATLVPNIQKDVDDLSRALRSLVRLKGDKDSEFPAPVLIFNEGDLSTEQKKILVSSTNRPVGFPLVDFSEFPEGFNPNEETSEFAVKGRSSWGYYQMIRFWVTGIWMHPALKPYRTVMRMDSDSCFMEDNDVLPNLPFDHINYHSQYVGLEPNKDYVKGLFEWNKDWLESRGKLPGNPLFWNMAKSSYELHGTLPLFRTNFEVSRKSYMQRRDIYRWFEALTEKEPFGIFRHRWGDAVIKYLMAATFLSSETVVCSKPDGYAHKELCDAGKYNERYGTGVLDIPLLNNADLNQDSAKDKDVEGTKESAPASTA